MNYMDDPFSRDLKRIEVARRMVLHQVRTQSIVDYTSLTRNRLATLRRRWCVGEDSRRRGPAPHSIEVTLRRPRVRSEAAAIVSLCIAYDALPSFSDCESAARSRLVMVDRLCEAFEAFRTWMPQSTIELEELLLLAKELAAGNLVELSICRGCKSAILVLKHGFNGRNCPRCDRNSTETRDTSR